ncbi:MAG: DNA modification methylase [Phycisphaeraceae bacterium]|nr:DNA modification methylase [Phycisphaeraceae bacterium]
MSRTIRSRSSSRPIQSSKPSTTPPKTTPPKQSAPRTRVCHPDEDAVPAASRGSPNTSPPASLRLERIAARRINPAPYNPRLDLKPGDPDYEKLARSVDEFGLVEPLVWNRRTGNLVGGHQRFKILLARGVKEVDVSVVDLPIEREKALNIALNKISGDWDERKLGALLDELTATPDLDVLLTGFDMCEIDGLIANSRLELDPSREESFDIEEALRLAGKGPAITKPGDLITLGRDPRLQHRLLCGDSTDHAQVRRLMNGERAILFSTDPPYLVAYDGTNHPGKGKANKDWSDTYGVTWDDSVEDTALYDGFIGAAVAEAIAPNAAWYCWHASRRQAMLESMWIKHGAFVHAQVIWVKNRGVLTRTWYAWQHEPCLFGWIVGKKPPRRSSTYLSTVWQIPTIPNGDERPDHPTPKPLEVFIIPMDQHTRPGEICYEPFAGSGSQFIAAEKLGRRCFGIEISPTYCDLIVRRYIAFAGEGAVDPAIAKKYRLTDRQPARASAAPSDRSAAQTIEAKAPEANARHASKPAARSRSTKGGR